MDRRPVVRAALAAAVVTAAGLMLATCSNPFDILQALTTEVKVANNKFLLISDSAPAKNVTDVSPAAYMWVEFDRDLDESSVTPDSITIVSETGVPIGWTSDYEPATRTLNIFPTALDSQVWYTVTLTGALKGTDGSDLQASYAWTFKTKNGPSGSVTINSGAPYTASTAVTLNLTYNADSDDLRWSTNPSDITTNYSDGMGNYINNLPGTPSDSAIILPSVDGSTTVHVQYWNSAHDAYTSVIVPPSATIVLDTTPPPAPTLAINGGAAYAALTTPLTIAATDATSPVTQMQFSNDDSIWLPLEAFNTTKSAWGLVDGAEGSRTVYVRVTDAVGNTSASGSDTVILDKTGPVITAFTIGSGDPAATSLPSVTLSITATDSASGVAQARYGNSGQAYSAWESYAATKSWTLQDKAGTRRTYVQVKDAVGNASTQVFDEILLYARIEITYTQIYVSNDGDAQIKGTDAGEIAYYLYGPNSIVTRVYPDTLSRSSGTYITSTDLPQTSETFYRNPTAGQTTTLSGYIYDYDGDPGMYQYGYGTTLFTAPYTAGVTTGSFLMPSVTGAAGTAYYTFDFQNP